MDIPMEMKLLGPNKRRLWFLVAIASTNLGALYLMTGILRHTETGFLNYCIFALFTVLFFWISFYFWTAVIGFFTYLSGTDSLAISRSVKKGPWLISSRTALIMPIRNENTQRVFAGIETMLESLLETGMHSFFDFFVLSDTSDPQIRSEEKEWAEIMKLKTAGKFHFFYRNREHNHNRKVGNIRDFCTRWGKNYKYMIILDADSIMTGDTMIKMVAVMERNPRVALVQVPPYPVNQLTLFARIQQFACRMYGPIIMAGLNFWQSGSGNYWGHNAILRIEPYMKHCELPRLPGKEPFGGELWSHDFVEAALLRAAGWGVWLAYDLNGSYEEIPQNIVAYAQRDLRWCKGNLQHTRFLGMSRLHPISRFHLLSGIMSYLCSPLLILLILAVGMDIFLNNLGNALSVHSAFFSGEPAMVFLTSFTCLMFLLPRILGMIWHLRGPDRLRHFGGGVKACLSVLLETIFSFIIAPIFIVIKTRNLISCLMGIRIKWERHAKGNTRLKEALTFHGGQTFLGLLAGSTILLNADLFFWWYAPALFWLVLAIPISICFSRIQAGEKARRAGLFVIPEESDPPRIIAHLQMLTARNRHRRAFLYTGEQTGDSFASLLETNCLFPNSEARDLYKNMN
jgi:membrane glycosyltransferase